ncbi:putative Cucumisin [Fagus crenata]
MEGVISVLPNHRLKLHAFTLQGHGTSWVSREANLEALKKEMSLLGSLTQGLSINRFDLNGTSFPLIWGGDAANYSAGANSEISKNCLNGTMNSYKVRGKIVFCETIWDGTGIILANGVGTIMAVADSSIIDFADGFPLPATLISREDGLKVLDYIRSTDLITAPGVDILAAWAPVAHRSAKFHIISGTSTSCPHASGAAAYVKAAHPNWSPAAIKSAHMTTAYIMDSKKNRDLEFAYGSGHINPLQAVDPGLIYDATEADYKDFLCKQGYNTTTTVTNVGSPNSTYTLSMYMPTSIAVTVEPSVLSFSALGEKKSFTVQVYGPNITQQPILS